MEAMEGIPILKAIIANYEGSGTPVELLSKPWCLKNTTRKPSLRLYNALAIMNP